MAFFSIPDIKISGISASVPENKVDNLELACLSESERKAFIEKVGIRSRRIAPQGLCASDLCVAAAEQLLEKSGLTPGNIGVLVFVSQTPDYILPGNSMLVQQSLGLSPSTFLLDVNQGCAGYVYGLSVLAGVMHSAKIEKGLLLVGDTISRLISPHDRSTLPIFSDAGSATLLEFHPGAPPIHFNLGADGKAAKAIHVRDGGARHPFQPQSLEVEEAAGGIRRAPVHLAMKGIDVFQHTLRHVLPNIKELLASSGWRIDDPDHFVFHQANKILNHGLLKKIGIPLEKAPESLSTFGNTSCATIPVTICHSLAESIRNKSSKLLLSGFGVGFSWGSALIETGPMVCPDIQEIN